MPTRHVAFALLVTVLLSSSVRADDPAVRIGVPNWTSVRMTANVIKAISERYLEIPVELVEEDNEDIYDDIRSGGEIDIHPEVWIPNHLAFKVDELSAEDGPMVMTATSYDAIQGICVTKDAAAGAEITSIHDLADPKKAAALDSDGDGKGELWIGSEGWGSTMVERVKARTYGYADMLDLRIMNEHEGLAALAEAVEANRPFAFFCYGPHYVFQLYDLTLLEEPAYNPARWKMVSPDQDPNWLENASIDVAWPPTRVHIGYTKALAEKHPELAELLENIQLNSRLVSGWTYAAEVDNVDPAAYADGWVRENPELVEGWLNGPE